MTNTKQTAEQLACKVLDKILEAGAINYVASGNVTLIAPLIQQAITQAKAEERKYLTTPQANIDLKLPDKDIILGAAAVLGNLLLKLNATESEITVKNKLGENFTITVVRNIKDK